MRTPTQVGYGTQVVITVEEGAVKVFVVQNSVPMQPSYSPQPTAAVGVISGEYVESTEDIREMHGFVESSFFRTKSFVSLRGRNNWNPTGPGETAVYMFFTNAEGDARCLTPPTMIGGLVADDRQNTKSSIILTYETANAVGQDVQAMEVSDSGSQDSKLDMVERLTRNKSNIRNVSVLSATGNHRSQLRSLLAENASHPRPDNEPQGSDSRDTLTKQIVQSFCVQLETRDQQDSNRNEYLLNLITDPDCPDQSQAAALSLRITDGALIIFDAGLGIWSQAEGLLSTALLERNRVTILLDIGSLLTQRQSKEDLYQTLCSQIHAINAVIETSSQAFCQVCINPHTGNIAFSCLAQGWAVSLPQFAARHGKRLGVLGTDLAARLWGNNYFDPETRVWDRRPEDSENPPDQSFNAFILDPIFDIYDALRSDSHGVQDILTTFGITLDDTEQRLPGESLIRATMQKLFPACDTVLAMICTCLPSPPTAQEYRAEWLYQGPLDDEVAIGIRTCDENGPLVLYATRPLPTSDRTDYYFLGRVFSGTVSDDQHVRRLQDSGRSRHVGRITRASIVSNSTALALASVPAGNIVAIQGKVLEKSDDQNENGPFTVTTSHMDTRCRDMTFMDMAALYVIIGTDDDKDTPLLVQGIRSLSRSNPYLAAFIDETGQYIIQGFTDLQVQKAIEELRTFLNGIPIRISEPLFRYREGIKSPSEEVCMTTSPNKKIRLYARASPLPEQLTDEISTGEIPTTRDSDRHGTHLTTHHDWPPETTRKIWSFAPRGSGPNILVDSTVAVQYVSEVRDSLSSGFQWAVREGPLCEEPLRGVRIDVVDIVMMTDAQRRGSGQLIPTIRRAVYGSVLRARPFLLEGVHVVEVHVCGEFVGAVKEILDDRNGVVVNEGTDPLDLHVIQAHVRSGQVVGLQQAVSSAAGRSTYVCIWFDRWEEYEGDQAMLVRSVRERKGLSPTPSSWETFHDTL
ncbi:hypothetical protein BJY00DRAFT_315764 [Aspergillus carlsbadensis]|nr:hypothetical protein BJY00DRAFT_315764 [Aspergillus carlsbadensis]